MSAENSNYDLLARINEAGFTKQQAAERLIVDLRQLFKTFELAVETKEESVAKASLTAIKNVSTQIVNLSNPAVMGKFNDAFVELELDHALIPIAEMENQKQWWIERGVQFAVLTAKLTNGEFCRFTSTAEQTSKDFVTYKLNETLPYYKAQAPRLSRSITR